MEINTVSGREISKIGIGSWGIGGFGHRDMELTNKRDDSVYINALVHALNRGMNFSEIALGYGYGFSLELFKQAIDRSNIKREDIFITHSLYPRDLDTFQVIENDTKDFYQVMDTDYADSTLVTESLIIKFGEQNVYDFLRRLLTEGKTRYVSLSNGSPEAIRKYHQEFGNKFYAHEGHISFEIRVLQDQGIINLCDQLGITNVIWRPLRQGRTAAHRWPLLTELADKYQKTHNQVVLNWMCHLGYRPMVMSTNTAHIDENLASIGFTMSALDYQRLTDFRPKYKPAVDETGINIVTLANEFEKFEQV